MPANQRVIFLDFQPVWIITPVLERDVHVTALRAAELNQSAVAFAFLRHDCALTIDSVTWSSNNEKPLMGFEPMTFPLPRECSAPELQRRFWMPEHNTITGYVYIPVGRAGLEPAKRVRS